MATNGTLLRQRFAVLVRNRRRASNLTQEQLAARMGVAQPSISAWECGEALPTMETLLILLQELDITLKELLALRDDDDEAA